MSNDQLTKADIDRARASLEKPSSKEPIYITKWLADWYRKVYGYVPYGMKDVSEVED